MVHSRKKRINPEEVKFKGKVKLYLKRILADFG